MTGNPSQATFHTVTSTDGTTIAYEPFGSDTAPLAVIVGGAYCNRFAFRELAQELGSNGLLGVTYDRRGRGDSTETKPYSVQREIEDLTAIIEAVGGPDRPAHVHGISSGGALVLEAMAAGAPITTASVLEPPYRVDGAPPMPDRYVETLEELEAADDREGILRYFHTKAVGMPEELLEPMRGTPVWDDLLSLSFTVRHDGLCLGPDSALPAEKLATISAPVLALSSTGTAIPFLPAAARAVAESTPNGTYRELEGGFHELPSVTAARAIAEFVGRR